MSNSLKPGIYYDVPNEVYHREWKAVNKSNLYLMTDCPARYRYNVDNPTEQTDAMLMGSVTHMLTYEPEKFGEYYAIAPQCDRRTNDGKILWADFSQANSSKQILKAEDFEKANAMAQAVRSHPGAMRELKGCKAEVSIVFEDTETGILCKVRPDGLRLGKDGVINDLKTTASLDGFARDARNFGYFFQAAFYRYGVFQATDELLPFRFIAVEKDAPHLVKIFELTEETLQTAIMVVRQSLDALKKCIDTNEWPDYGSQIYPLHSDWQKGVSYA